MQIRDLERPLLPRVRSKSDDPLRKTAKDLGTFLDKLTVAVRDAADKEDTVDDSIRDKNKNAAFRRFKLRSAIIEDEPKPLPVDLDEEQERALELLREARSLAADAGMRSLSVMDRLNTQTRFDDIFRELSAHRISTLISLSSVVSDSNGDPLFSLTSPETSHDAYRNVEEIILKIYELDTKSETGSVFITSEHETAQNAAVRLSEFLLEEGPENAFARFREINRSNILGLLK